MLFMTHIVETLQRWTSPSAPQPVFHSPHALKAALARERARSDRSGTVFSFLTFTREAGVPKATLENVLHVLRGRLRTTDEFGWFDDRQVGVVLLDAPATQTWLIADGVFAEWPESLATPRCEVFSYPSHEPVHLPVTCPDRSARPARPDGSSSVAAISGVSRPIQRLEPFFVRRMALLKRIVDASGALLGMLVTAPFIALAALAVRLTSPGPAIYRQERAGVGGEPFIIYKLRTMRVDADTRQHELADLNEQDGPASKIEKDPRVTPVGRFLRKTSLDELPQLWNVLRGDMSLVGPRPLPMAEAQTCEAWQQRRLDVTPGLTGVWQVEGRARTGFTDWVRMDMRYIRAGCSSATSSYSHSPCLPSCFERAHTSRLAPPFVVPTAGRPSRNGRRLHRQRAGADNSEGGFPVMTVTKRLAGSTSTALNRMLGSRSAGALGILVYHRIAPRIRSYPPPTMNCQPESLQAQLRGLVARGYEVWPLARVLACHESGDTIPPRTLVITFDDGFESVYTDAWPVLKALGLPATIFLNTAFLDGELFPFDPWGRRWQLEAPASAVRPLRTSQCAEMRDHGLVELGAPPPTHTHQDFRGRLGAFEADLRTNVSTLLETFGVTRPSFAFPFVRPHLGFVTPTLVTAARQTGVRCGLTTLNELVDIAHDPFWWGRFNACDTDTADTLDAKLSGWYGWIPKMQEWMHRRRSA